MQVILKGSLRHFPPAGLLRFIAAAGQGGTLDLVSADGTKVRLFVRDGCIVCGQGAAATDVLGCVAEALEYVGGAFALVDEVVLPDDAKVESLTIAAVVDAAEKRLALAKSFGDETIFRVIEDPDSQPQISMTPDEFKILMRIGPGKRFVDLMEGRSRDELTNVLRAMEERGLIRHEERVPAAEAPTQIFTPPPEAAKKRAAALTGDGGAAYALLDDAYLVGRDDTNDIPIADSSISVHHARFTRDGESYSLEDLGSRNGTFVNGEGVTAPRILADNDVIRFGRVLFTFNLANEIRPGETTERKMTTRRGTRQ
jgi:hypothetical protein